jgi:predicted CXXCH cytochrome family protein
MKIPTRPRDWRAGPGQWVRSLRGGFVITVIAIGLLLAYLPGVAASTDGLPDPTPVLESSPSPLPDPSAIPSQSPADDTPSPTPSVEPQPTPTDAGSPSPTWSPEPSPSASAPSDVGLVVSHVTAATLGLPGSSPTYLAPDVALVNLPRFQVFRLRFEVQNTDATDVAWHPALELVQSDGSAVPLPAGDGSSGQQFYAAREWVPDGAGSRIGPTSTVIPAGDGMTAGIRSMGVNPLPEMAVAAGATTVVEFSLSATADATYQASYDFVLTDAGSELAGAARATVVMQEKPAVRLSPGQRQGIPADASVPQTVRYGLTAPDGSDAIHSPSNSLTSDTCAACHRAHAAPGSQLTAAPSQLALCSSCHNGTDLPDIRAAYDAAPQNDPATRSYYQHDPAVVGGALGTGNDCSDCHNPHYATSTASAAGPDGWTASGRIAATSGVAVAYDPTTSQPTYTLVPRTELEYQLCFKCHSGYAQLPSNDGQPPSHYELDAAIEFNPANGSYHPIEAPGTNQTTQMDASLAGTSPYKLWTFTSQSTIRCVNCHADASLAATGSPPLGADASLPVHASSERGILLAQYQDRVLKGPTEPYQAADFALCFLCHSEAPFLDTSGDVRSDTNFRYHGLHVSGSKLLDHGSPGTDIDTPGDGSGLAICAECHFRVHSTAFPIGDQPAGSRLVDFAPDVTAPTGGGLSWTPLTDTTAGTCTLKCHGQPHATTY